MRKIRVFVSLPEGETYKKIYNKAIKPLVKGNLEIICYEDRPITSDPFENAIRKLIAFSNLVIGILIGNNRNVLYEIGMALAYGKPVLIITDFPENLEAMVKKAAMQLNTSPCNVIGKRCRVRYMRV